MACMRRIFIAIASGFVIVLMLYIGVCWLILSVLITPERKRGPIPTANELGVAEIRSMYFKSAEDEIRLRGWLVPTQGNRAIVLVHGLHSYAWDCQTPDIVQAYAAADFSVFLFDLRGHGDSGGNSVGLGLLESGDVRAAVDLLLEQGFHSGRIGIHGASYGAATALLAAEQIEEVGAVIADSAFADMRDVIGGELERQTGLPAVFSQILTPGLRILGLRLYSLDIYLANPEHSISRISARPILLIHGAKDSVIPYDHARRLKAAAGPKTKLWTLPGGHTEGVRLAQECEKASPSRDAFLTKVTRFFDANL